MSKLHPLAAAWRERGGYLQSDGREIFVVDTPATEEQAEPLLVLHGFPSCSIDWRHVLPRLSERRRVVLLDFCGFGLSEKPDIRYGIRVHAQVAQDVAVQLGLERVALVTHDMGDTVGGELLARSLEGNLPFEITERVLTNGSIYLELAQLTPGQQLLWSLEDARLPNAGADGGEAFKRGLASTFADQHQPSDEELELQWQMLSFRDGHTLLPRLIRYLDDRREEEARFTGAIETHPSPLGVVWGDQDPVAVYAMAERLVSRRPETRLVTLEGVGHYPMIEDPDAFADAVLSLLS